MMSVKETERSFKLLFLVAIVGAMFVFAPEQQPTVRQDFNQLPTEINQ